MEVNGYLPSHVRVFTDEENNFKPQIITEAIHLDLDGLDMEKVYELKEAEKNEEPAAGAILSSVIPYSTPFSETRAINSVLAQTANFFIAFLSIVVSIWKRSMG